MKCVDCKKEIKGVAVQKPVAPSSIEKVNGVYESPSLVVCEPCHDLAQAEVMKDTLAKPNGEQSVETPARTVASPAKEEPETDTEEA